ncbi:TetR family transcriptional regulator C-terminal domain-containing protein [Mesorhizobium atlanticum]
MACLHVEAQKSTELRRLLRIYARRLHSNLMSGLTGILLRNEADRVAETTAALIDGLYITPCAEGRRARCCTAAIAPVEDYLETKLDGRSLPRQPGDPIS